MDFNTRKHGPPTPIGEPIPVSAEEIAAIARAPTQDFSTITVRVLRELHMQLTDAQQQRLLKPVVRYQKLEPGRALAGPVGWHIDFYKRRPCQLFLYVSHGPSTLFLRDSDLTTPVDPDLHQRLFNAHVDLLGLQTWKAPVGQLIRYDNSEAHRAQVPAVPGWRYFFRALLPD